MRLRHALLLLLLATMGVHAQKKTKAQESFYTRPGLKVDLKSAKFTTARESCENWALAAGLETLLKDQGVSLDQTFWIMRLYGGELCVSSLPAMGALAESLNNEFVLDDGRHVRLQFNFAPGAPANVDAIISALKEQKTSVVIWRGHPYYLTGLTYDEHIGQVDGSRLFEITELRLANTFARQPGTAFVRGRDNPQDIQGMITVSVQ